MMKLVSAIIVGLFISGASFAQQPNPQQGQSNYAASEINITSEDVKKFEAVQPAIASIQQELGVEIGKAESTDEARELQVNAQEKMVKVVMKSGLSVEKYNAIAQGAATKTN
jgi:hypothetical protein